MRALIVDGSRKQSSFKDRFSLTDLPVPHALNEALIRVTLAGICNTDLEIAKGYMNFFGVPGHEFVGVVEAAPDPEWLGKRVVGEINAGCKTCDHCRANDPRHCAERTVLGIAGRQGAFAQRLLLPVQNLHEVPEHLSDEAAVFVEPIAAACQIATQVDLEGKKTLIIGDGKLAQLIARVLPLYGANCTVVGKHSEKLALIPAGCDTILVPQRPPVMCYDVAVEASGKPEGFAMAVESLVPRGTFVVKSTYAQTMHINPAPLVIHEINLIGSRCGRFEPALKLLSDGKIDPTPLITARYPLDRAIHAIEHAMAPDALKILLEMP